MPLGSIYTNAIVLRGGDGGSRIEVETRSDGDCARWGTCSFLTEVPGKGRDLLSWRRGSEDPLRASGDDGLFCGAASWDGTGGGARR